MNVCMNTIDRINWLDIAIMMHLQTLEHGRVRAIGSLALMPKQHQSEQNSSYN